AVDCGGALCRSVQPTWLPLQIPIAPHQFEETHGIPHRIDAADFVGIDGRDRNRCDAMAFPARDDQHFGFVLEPAGAAQNFGNDIAMQHAKPTLRIRNLLPADATDFAAHVPVHNPPPPQPVLIPPLMPGSKSRRTSAIALVSFMREPMKIFAFDSDAALSTKREI